MVTFARYADSVSPPTLDHEALLGLLDQVRIIELPPEDGTAIGDAIVRAIDMLEQAEGASKVMILLTDGSYNAGEVEPLVAAQVAGAYGIRIYTIGAGTQGTALMPVAAADGGTEYLPSEVSIDEATLTQIAQLTEGKYFRATDAEALRSIYAEIDRLEKVQNVAEHHQRYVDVYPLVIAIGLALLLLESVLVTTRLRTIP
jgi:Ca-activated chloride channel family protein